MTRLNTIFENKYVSSIILGISRITAALSIGFISVIMSKYIPNGSISDGHLVSALILLGTTFVIRTTEEYNSQVEDKNKNRDKSDQGGVSSVFASILTFISIVVL